MRLLVFGCRRRFRKGVGRQAHRGGEYTSYPRMLNAKCVFYCVALTRVLISSTVFVFASEQLYLFWGVAMVLEYKVGFVFLVLIIVAPIWLRVCYSNVTAFTVSCVDFGFHHNLSMSTSPIGCMRVLLCHVFVGCTVPVYEALLEGVGEFCTNRSFPDFHHLPLVSAFCGSYSPLLLPRGIESPSPTGNSQFRFLSSWPPLCFPFSCCILFVFYFHHEQVWSGCDRQLFRVANGPKCALSDPRNQHGRVQGKEAHREPQLHHGHRPHGSVPAAQGVRRQEMHHLHLPGTVSTPSGYQSKSSSTREESWNFANWFGLLKGL